MKEINNLPGNCLWTISDSLEYDTDVIVINDDERTINLRKLEYPEEIYNSITQADTYKIVCRSKLETSTGIEYYHSVNNLTIDHIIVKDDLL